MDEKKQVLTIRFFLAIFILVSVVLALIQYKSSVTFIAQLMGISWGALAGSFLGPFLYGLYWKRATKTAVWASFITGVGITVSNMFIGYISSPINAGVYAMLASLVIVPVVSLMTKRPDSESSDKIFSCFKKNVTVQDKE
jgi:SSS family solute:Na+ symporter